MIEDIKKIFPAKMKNKIAEMIYNIEIKRRIVRFYFEIIFDYMCGKLGEYKEEVFFIVKHGITMFPYDFSKKYSDFQCEILYDYDEEKYYVFHKGKRLYFPKGIEKEEIKRAYKQLIMEQESESPHCYWSNINRPARGDVFVDVGAAEGMIALEWIDIVDKAILIECDEAWKDALISTFAPYQEKVKIISRYCCEKEGTGTTTIDNIVGGVDNLVIKMDIEGAEISALKGAEKTLKNKKVKWAVCTYHRKNDANDIENIMKENDIEYEYSSGYLILPYDLQHEYPYFRKGVIRGRNWGNDC